MTRSLSVSSRVSTLALAVALVAGPSPADAQSFQGTVDSQVGASVDQSVAGQTTVTITQQQAVIDWTATATPSGGTIVFQQDGTNATFVGASDFAVLNRVMPGTAGNAIYMGGNITSLIGENVGGTVYFYSPNGIIIGQNASINVGSLGLTTLPIEDDGSANAVWMQGFGTADPQVTFGQATDTNSFIRTNPVIDGSINAFGAGSYVAMVAPIIQHSGLIRTDRAAALVAAEAAVITFSPNSLFDIQVTVGTEGGERLTVDGGTITRNPNTPEGTHHHAYLVAVAKNDAVTMAIENGGSIGFETATSAQNGEDNIVILTSGELNDSLPVVGNADNRVDLSIDSSSFSSNVLANVSGSADIRTSTGDTDFGRNLTLLASENSIITAVNGNFLSVGGDLFVGMDEIGPGADTVGSTFRLSATGGSDLSVAGDVWLSSQVTGAGEGGSGVDAPGVTGGTVIIQTGTGSSIDIAGNLDIDVDAIGGDHGGSDGTAGGATGGTAQILANGGSSLITVDGTVNISADASGGNHEECSICDITGGNAVGGNILLETGIGANNQLDFNSSVTLSATAEAGAGDVVGGSAEGGNVQLNSRDAGTIGVASFLLVDAWASGGYGSDDLNDGTPGGSAIGGDISMSFNGNPSFINLDGGANLFAYANGGDGGTGGDATGGRVLLQLGSSGTFSAPTIYATTGASGGSGDIGGDATGGQNWIQALGGAVLNLGDVELDSAGSGGFGSVGAGGSGTGGNILVGANAATLNISGDLSLAAAGSGGTTNGDVAPGGLGQGGQVEVAAASAGLVNLDGFVDISANGFGGGSTLETAQSGDGSGGDVIFQASGGGAIDAAGDVFLAAYGFGGFAGNDCNDCGGAGGDGFGGDVRVEAQGTADVAIFVGGELRLIAEGIGADGFGGAAGSGTGGTASLLLNNDGTMEVIGDVSVQAIGRGGDHDNGGTGGSGSGGTAEIRLDPTQGLLTVSGLVNVNASGLGGDAFLPGGTGGAGLGGLARINVFGGLADLQGDVDVNSNAQGGAADEGTGGGAQSGRARVIVDGGALDVGADLTLNSISTGGSGVNGGDALAFIGTNPVATATSDARVVAGNGAITVGGFTSLNVSALGGAGSNGGTGGDAAGGFAVVHALNRDAGDGTVTLGDLGMNVSATGGAGGTGISGNSGGNGGAGGSATGGWVVVTASAGNGHLDIGNITASVSATGGAGGDGGTGDAGLGGNGGVGGAAAGGFVQIGTESGIEQALANNNGTADISSVVMLANATGGNGGNGGFSPAGSGAGGDGGDAGGGTAVLLVRGSELTVGSVSMTANATGGNGGTGSALGNGGDAESDEVAVLVTNRAGNAAQRGTLNAGVITGTATSTGGSGGVAGASMMEGGSAFIIENSEATIASLDFTITAADQIADLATDMIAIVNGQATIAGAFNFDTDGVASVYADDNTPLTPALTADSFSVSADNFVHDPDRTFPALVGTISADMFAFNTNGDLIIDANLVSTSSLNLVAPGLIDIEDATSGSDLTLDAGGSISGGTLAAAGLIDAAAGGDIGLDLVNAGSDITMRSTGGSILANGMSAGGLVDLHASIDVSVGDITSDGAIAILADSGDISTGDLLASNGVDLQAAGDIAFGDISAFIVNLDAGGSIAGGSIDSETDISALAGGDIDLVDLFAGGITVEGFTAGNVIVSAGGAISTGVIDAFGSVEADAGGDITTDSIDALGFIQLLAGLDVLTGPIDAGADIEIFTTGGDIQTAQLTGTFVDLAAEVGGIEFGAVNADILDFEAAGAVSGGDVNADAHVIGEAGGAIALGDINAGLPIDEDFSVGLASATSISVGDVTAPGNIGFATFGSLSTGDLSAGALIMTLVGGDISVGSMSTADAFGRIFMADSQMYVNAGGLDDNFDPDLVFQADMIPTGGSVTVGGTIDTSLLEIAAGGLITLNGDVATDGATLMSADLALANGVTVGGSTSLYSLNSQGTFIGDGLTGPGYMLSNAEFNAFQDIGMEVRPDLGAAALLLLGDLDINSAISEVALGIEDADDNDLGTIRVVGDVRMNNADGELFFESETFQLDAATGSILISADGTTPGGELIIAANNIHVAEGSILDRLAEDPQYDGYQDELNAPASVQRPGGVIRAGTVSIEFGDTPADLYTLYVQNVGTEETPAGFVITDMDLGDDGEGTLPAGSVDLIINGQIITATGTLTGIDVRDLLVQGRDLTPFTDNSTVNGCLLAGECGDVVVPPVEPPVPPGFQPTPGIQKEITLVKDNLLPPPDFGNEDFIDDNDEETEDGATSPIVPPDPLFDTSQLGEGSEAAAAEFGTSMRSNPGLVRPGDVDDPVSGSGNPGLMETTARPPSKEEKKQ